MKLPTIIRQHYKLIIYWAIGSIIAIAVLISLVFYFAGVILAPTSERSDQVVEFVKAFGDELPQVSLASSTEEIAVSMDEHYAPYLSSDLLTSWKSDPTTALGKSATGVVPAGLRVKSVRNVGTLSYIVKVYIETRTPVVIPGLGSGYQHGEKPYTLGVTWRGGGWEITEYTEGHAAPTE